MFAVTVLRKFFVLSAVVAFLMLADAAYAQSDDYSVPQFSDSISSLDGFVSASQKDIFARIGNQLNAVPEHITSGNSVAAVSCKTLPAVPAAFFMALTGFLCVTLIKDRKVWISTSILLVSVACASVGVLPRLASGMKLPTAVSGKVFSYEQSWVSSGRDRLDVEGRSYVALLRRLAGLVTKENDVSSNSTLKDTRLFCDGVFAIAKLADLNTHNICLSLGLVQFSYFTPAFTKSNHAHGPPAFIF
jgi:hypothetical protein